MKNNALLLRIVKWVLWSNLPFLVTAYWFWPEFLGWFLGSVASAGRLIWLEHDVRKTLDLSQKKAKIAGAKGYYFRFLALVIYSVLVVYFLQPNIIMFGMGLLSAQLAIYLDAIRERYYKK
ncbi:MAG: ATP synthase subunit I [Candidatus Cloacimonadales bacterium]